jgi:hypothetical protein
VRWRSIIVPASGHGEPAMNAFYDHHRDSIRFGDRCFDRILLDGLIQPFQQPEIVVGFVDAYRTAGSSSTTSTSTTNTGAACSCACAPIFRSWPRVYLNRHHWLTNRLREEDIDFQQCSNAFLRCASPASLQQLANALTAQDLSSCTRKWLARRPSRLLGLARDLARLDDCGWVVAGSSASSAVAISATPAARPPG